MRILTIDPSGNHGKEGMGTTGYAVIKNGVLEQLGELKASTYDTEVQYWNAHNGLIRLVCPDIIVMEGYRLYHHKGMKADSQANSELQTPQLIGVIKVCAWNMDIPLHIQFAAEVKTRWDEKVLVRKGILEQKNNRYYWNGRQTNNHMRDAIKHGMHYWRYKRNE